MEFADISPKNGNNQLLGLSIKNLKKKFGDVIALNNVSIDIHKGKIIGLLGQNGAGKSTLVRLLSGVMRPSYGTAQVFGYDLLKDTNKVKRITGLLPEEYALYEKLSVYEYIEFIATLYDMDKLSSQSRFEDLAEQLEIAKLKDRLIETLSKGQKQKVALIASIIHHPLALFLDEPLANLDIYAQQTVRQIIREYQRQDRIIMIATHLLSNVASVCDDVLIIHDGSILFSGSINEFQKDHKTLEDAYMMKIPHRLSGKIKSDGELGNG